MKPACVLVSTHGFAIYLVKEIWNLRLPMDHAPKLLHANRWVSLYERDGWVFASRRQPGAAARLDATTVIALHGEGGADAPHRLVVLEEYRVPIDGWEFGLPAGLLDGDEPVVECARRELREETGLELTRVLEQSGLTYSSPGLTDENQAFVVVTCRGIPSLQPGIEGERINVHLLGRAGCRELLERNRAGGAAITSRAWALLVAIAHAGEFAGVKIAE